MGHDRRVTEGDDWRITNQATYLTARRMKWAKWQQPRRDWDHDHCEFCWAEFAEVASDHAPNASGWVTADDGLHWVCAPCFEDFRGRFAWVVVTGKPTDR